MWKAVSLPCLSWWAGTKVFRWARGRRVGKGQILGVPSVGIGHCWGWEELIWVCRTWLAPSDAAPSWIMAMGWKNVGLLLTFGGVKWRAALFLDPGTAVTSGVSPPSNLLFTVFRLCFFMVIFFSFKDCLCWEKRNHSFKVCICLLWANLRMIHNSLGIWGIRHESIIFFCSFICYKQIHITFILSPHGCILKMIFSLSLSVIHNALISMCQRIAEKNPTVQLRASVEHFRSKSDFFSLRYK